MDAIQNFLSNSMLWLQPQKISTAPDGVKPLRLFDVVRDTLCVKHYSLRTEEQYMAWIRRFVRFHPDRHPRDMGAAEVSAFLTHLAVAGGVSASTQNQALSALLFLYREVLGITLPWLDEVVRAKPSKHLPMVLSRREVSVVLAHTEGLYGLQLQLLYGTGLRLMECMRLRVKDIDFDRRELLVRDSKGATARPRRRGHHYDLYAPFEQRRSRSYQPAGRALMLWAWRYRAETTAYIE